MALKFKGNLFPKGVLSAKVITPPSSADTTYIGTGGVQQIELGFSPSFMIVRNITTDNPLNDFFMVWKSTNTGTTHAFNMDTGTASNAFVINNTGVTITGNDFGTNQAGQTYLLFACNPPSDEFEAKNYTGNGAATRNITHGLGDIPRVWYTVKRRPGSFDWNCTMGTINISNTSYINLLTNSGQTIDNQVWANTTPTASQWTIGSDTYVNSTSVTNGNEYTNIMFSRKDSQNSNMVCRAYTGNGTTRTFNTPFDPKLAIIRRLSNSDAIILSREMNSRAPNVIFASSGNLGVAVDNVTFSSGQLSFTGTNANINSNGQPYVITILG